MYYEGEMLMHVGDRNAVCASLCEKENDKCTAFTYHKYFIKLENATENRPIKWKVVRNCTLMVNVTRTIRRKIESFWRDTMYSGKKCKVYDPYRKTFDAGIVQLLSKYLHHIVVI